MLYPEPQDEASTSIMLSARVEGVIAKYAKNQELVTYGDLYNAVNLDPKSYTGRRIGSAQLTMLNDKYYREYGILPSVIVVNAATKIPSGQFFCENQDKMGTKQPHEFFEEERDKVFKYFR